MTRRASRAMKGVAVRSRRRRSLLPWRKTVLVTAIVVGVGATVVGLERVAMNLWSSIRAHPYFAVTEVNVRGAARVSRDQLLSWAGVRRGMSVWDADPTQLRVRLLRHPDLAEVRVRRDFPRRIVIAVRERLPVAIAVLDDLYFVDRTGHLMDRLRDDDSRDLPLITGVKQSDLDRGGGLLLRRATRLIRLCQRDGCGDGLSEIHLDARAGATLVPLRQPVAIQLGWGGWRVKLARATRVLTAWEGQEWRVASLDATYPGQVIVRMRPLPATKPSGRRGVRSVRI